MLIYSKIPFNRTIDFKSKGFPLSYDKNIEDMFNKGGNTRISIFIR